MTPEIKTIMRVMEGACPAAPAIYIVGVEDRLSVHRCPPRTWHGTDSKNKPWTKYGWPLSSTQHVDERGYLSEGKTFGFREKKRIFVRILPEDAAPMLAELDAAVEAAQLAYQRACDERREFLAAQAVRGKRVPVKHATPMRDDA